MIRVPRIVPTRGGIGLGYWTSRALGPDGHDRDGQWVCWLRCPRGHVGRLAVGPGFHPSVAKDSHSIDASGTVTPSAVCPDDACGFHEMLVLDDWRETPQ